MSNSYTNIKFVIQEFRPRSDGRPTGWRDVTEAYYLRDLLIPLSVYNAKDPDALPMRLIKRTTVTDIQTEILETFKDPYSEFWGSRLNQ